MIIEESILNSLDKNKIYCQKCLLEGQINPLEFSDKEDWLDPRCGHIGRNCNSLRFHNGEWHIFYGFSKEAKCRTCQAKKNLDIMNDPNGKPRQKLKNWYKSDKCKKILSDNANKWRNSKEGKEHAIKNCETYRNSELFKQHGADGLKKYINTKEFQSHIKEHNLQNCEKLNNYHREYCPLCKTETLHNGFGTCGICNPNIFRQIPNFIEHNHTIFFFDILLMDYIPWEDYKKKFKNVNLEIDFVNKIKLQYRNIFIQITFRTQDSDSWNGAKAAFEQNLLEQDIGWFAYIKFYIDDCGCIKPLVVGKTGSLNVNANGSDVSFSADINDGPARRFLIETGTVWDKTKILIIPCKDENEAFKIEKEIALNYNLFQS